MWPLMCHFYWLKDSGFGIPFDLHPKRAFVAVTHICQNKASKDSGTDQSLIIILRRAFLKTRSPRNGKLRMTNISAGWQGRRLLLHSKENLSIEYEAYHTNHQNSHQCRKLPQNINNYLCSSYLVKLKDCDPLNQSWKGDWMPPRSS